MMDLRRVFEPTEIRPIPGGYEFSHRDLLITASREDFIVYKVQWHYIRRIQKHIERCVLRGFQYI